MSQNTYILDAEDVREMERLLKQEHLLTKSMGGLFAERTPEDMSSIFDVLDIGCGPGGWLLGVAQDYPHTEVVGIDISHGMLTYAREQARLRMLKNANFTNMNALEDPLGFPDSSFDLVNIRLGISFIHATRWPRLLEECKRILRPRGVLRLTETEWGFTNKPAFETLLKIGSLSMNRIGHSFSPYGWTTGATCTLRYLLQRSGFRHIQTKAHMMDYSFGQDGHDETFEDYKLMFQLVLPFWLKVQVISLEDFERLYQEMSAEFQMEDFCAHTFLLTAWGEKPSKP